LKYFQLAPVLADGALAAEQVEKGIGEEGNRHSARAPDVLPGPYGLGVAEAIAVAALALLAARLRPEVGLRLAIIGPEVYIAANAAVGETFAQTRRVLL
jgi:hypothetical protein